ncbi:MAG: hypothetical protein IPO89_15100 [Actinomycetales bacterium]|nr:hypothetical protein [Candidatus Lutibacillus vidarii]
MGARSGWLASGAAAVVLALTGCSAPAPQSAPAASTQQPRPTSTPRADTGIPSPSSTTTDAQAALQAEAIALVERYATEWNKALVSRDSTALQALFLESCEACVREAADIDNLRQGNQHVVGGTLTLTSLTALRGTESGIGVTGVSTRAAVTIVDRGGKVVARYAEDRLDGVLWILERRGAVLKIRSVTL